MISSLPSKTCPSSQRITNDVPISRSPDYRNHHCQSCLNDDCYSYNVSTTTSCSNCPRLDPEIRADSTREVFNPTGGKTMADEQFQLTDLLAARKCHRTSFHHDKFDIIVHLVNLKLCPTPIPRGYGCGAKFTR